MRDVLNTTNIIMINQTMNIEMENEYREVDNFHSTRIFRLIQAQLPLKVMLFLLERIRTQKVSCDI